MVKESTSPADKAPNSGTKRSLLETFGDEENETLWKETEDIVQVSGPSMVNNRGSIPFDGQYKRCFIIEEMTDVIDAKIKTDDPNVSVFKKVFNFMMVDPMGERRVGSIWSHNAEKINKSLVYVIYFT